MPSVWSGQGMALQMSKSRGIHQHRCMLLGNISQSVIFKAEILKEVILVMYFGMDELTDRRADARTDRRTEEPIERNNTRRHR